MSDRDELADVIKPAAAYDYWPQKAAELALAAGYRKPRTVTTTEDLDELFNSDGNVVVMDEDGMILQNLMGGWKSPTADMYMTSDLVHHAFGPKFTVLHEVAS